MIKHVDENGIVYNVVDIRRSNGLGGYVSINKIIHNNLEIIVKQQSSEHDNIYLVMWIDDFYGGTTKEDLISEHGADNWQDFVENYLMEPANSPLYLGASMYVYTGETFEWNNDLYYLWNLHNSSTSSERIYLLTDTIDYDELYNNSLEASYTNEWCPYIARFHNDYKYNEENEKILVSVCNSPQELWMKYEGLNDNWENYIDGFSYANEYRYTGETFEWNGTQYYLWMDDISDNYFILTDTIDYRELAEKSIVNREGNYYNMNCPYVAILDNDYNLIYQASQRQSDWLIGVDPDPNNPEIAKFIYIDDFDALEKLQ